MIRTFIAISVPGDIKRGLLALESDLRGLRIDARYPRSAGIHLTLKFPGDVEEQRISEIEQTLAEAIYPHRGFSLKVEGLGVFPHLSNPRVVWVGIENSAALIILQQAVDRALGLLGFQIDKRKFHPHLTLARIRSRRNIAQLMHYVEQQSDKVEMGQLEVASVQLYKSTLQPSGAVYDQLAQFELRGE